MDPEKQESEEKSKSLSKDSWKDRLTFGGNFWLGFGSFSSQVIIQPLVGYKVTDKFLAGGGLTYIYWKETYQLTNGSSLSFSDNIYGLNFFGRHTIFEPLFAHVEFQPLNFTSFNFMTGDNKRLWTNALYLGGGINQSFGKTGSGAYIMLLYDVLWRQSDPNGFQQSFYNSPYNIRFGLFL